MNNEDVTWLCILFFLMLNEHLPLNLVGSENKWDFPEESNFFTRGDISSPLQEFQINFKLISN